MCRGTETRQDRSHGPVWTPLLLLTELTEKNGILVNHKGTLWYPALASNKSWVRMQAWHEKQALPGELSFLPGELSFLPGELSFLPGELSFLPSELSFSPR